MRIILEDPPPFNADPYIIEWIDRQVHQFSNQAILDVRQCAKDEALIAYHEQLAILQECLKADLKALHENMDQKLMEH